MVNERAQLKSTLKSRQFRLRHQVAMLARDEEQLLRKHLPLWRDIGDCFVLGLDSRNQAGFDGFTLSSTAECLGKVGSDPRL